MPFRFDRRLNLVVQSFGGSPLVTKLLRLLVSEPNRSFTAAELAEWTNVSPEAAGRALGILVGSGLVSVFRHDGQARAYLSPLPPMRRLAREAVVGLKTEPALQE